MGKTGKTRTNWIYFVREVGCFRLFGITKGMTGKQLQDRYFVDPAKLIALRNELLSKKPNTKRLVNPAGKRLKSTKAITTKGKEVRIELVACYNPKTQREYIDLDKANPVKGTRTKSYWLRNRWDELRLTRLPLRTGNKKTIDAHVAAMKANATDTGNQCLEKHRPELGMSDSLASVPRVCVWYPLEFSRHPL